MKEQITMSKQKPTKKERALLEKLNTTEVPYSEEEKQYLDNVNKELSEMIDAAHKRFCEDHPPYAWESKDHYAERIKIGFCRALRKMGIWVDE